MNTKAKFLFCCFFLSLIAFESKSQVRIGEDNRVITSTVPFLNISPDARSAAMGDAGAAITPDANSVHWNPGKIVFAEAEMGASVNFTPWLGKIVDDMSISYLSGYKKIDDLNAVALEIRYFDLGDIFLFDEVNGLPVEAGQVSPREFSIGGNYSRKLSENLGIGVSLRFINSNITKGIASLDDNKAASTVAGDIGVYYTKDVQIGSKTSNLSWAGSISNIGGKITYLNEGTKDFIPTNLKLGTAFKTHFDPYNTITFALDFNKLMVPTPPIRDENGNVIEGKDDDRSVISGMFGSFGDAPDGFSEELKEISIAFGTEYWYNNVFAARAGYFYENEDKGDRKYFSVGLGFRYQVFGIDFAYLIPTEQEHPLAETLRFSLLFSFEEKGSSL